MRFEFIGMKYLFFIFMNHHELEIYLLLASGICISFPYLSLHFMNFWKYLRAAKMVSDMAVGKLCGWYLCATTGTAGS